MNERPTPETDTETMRDEYDHVDSDFGPFAPSDTVPADFARRLERERDEARELARTLAAFVEPDIWAGTAAHNAIDALESILAKTEEDAK